MCDVAEKELQSQSRAVVKDIETELTDERVQAAIERSAAAEERKLNESRWKKSDKQQMIAVQSLKELIERQELARISLENENAIRKRQERGKKLQFLPNRSLLIARRESQEAGDQFHQR